MTQMSSEQLAFSSATNKRTANVSDLDDIDKRVFRIVFLRCYERHEVPALHKIKQETKRGSGGDGCRYSPSGLRLAGLNSELSLTKGSLPTLECA